MSAIIALQDDGNYNTVHLACHLLDRENYKETDLTETARSYTARTRPARGGVNLGGKL